MNKNTPLYLCIGYIIAGIICNDMLKTGNAQLNAYLILGAIVGTWTYHWALIIKSRLEKRRKEIEGEENEEK